MTVLVVVDGEAGGFTALPGVTIVAAGEYLHGARWQAAADGAAGEAPRLWNLCRSSCLHSTGYYVSLLAEARGARPLPDMATLGDLRWQAETRRERQLDRLLTVELRDLGDLSGRTAAAGNRLALDVYFGESSRRQGACRRLAARLFALFPAPLLRAHLRRQRPTAPWRLDRVELLDLGALSDRQRTHAAAAAGRFLPSLPPVVRRPLRLAILHDPAARKAPSNPAALALFLRAADRLGIVADLVRRRDFAGAVGERRLRGYDALFVREATSADNATIRLARRAEAAGLITVDAPGTILKCANKVFLAELLSRHGIPTPRTQVVSRDNLDSVATTLGFPCVLKQPDGYDSVGVFKVDSPAELTRVAALLFKSSALIIAQAFMPSEFDWRIGIFDGVALYASRYYMAPRHWQVVKHGPGGSARRGRDESLRIEAAPPEVVGLALRATALLGDGLYGVDLKVVGGRPYCIEINDNPSIEHGIEDQAYHGRLYESVLQAFQRRADAR